MDSKTSVIKTGVDKLVDLIERKKKLSIDDAAKELLVPKVVIEEWANFLEEADIIKIEFKFATPYLFKRDITEKEIKTKVKDFHGRKEGILRKLESTLQYMEEESAGLKGLKESFANLTKEIGLDVQSVKKDLETLERYESLKRDIDKEIMKQQQTFHEKIDKITDQILRKKEDYKKLLSDIKKQELKLLKDKQMAGEIMKNEEQLQEKLDKIMDTVNILKDRIKSEEDVIEEDATNIERLTNAAEKVEKEIEERKAKVNPLLEESKKLEDSITQMQENILQKVAEKRDDIKKGIEESKKAKSQFRTFFEKKLEINSMIDKLNFELVGLENSIKSMLEEAKAIELTSKSKNLKEYVGELEQKFADVNKRKAVFESEIKKLGNLIKLKL